jgi:hypothetical protein
MINVLRCLWLRFLFQFASKIESQQAVLMEDIPYIYSESCGSAVCNMFIIALIQQNFIVFTQYSELMVLLQFLVKIILTKKIYRVCKMIVIQRLKGWVFFFKPELTLQIIRKPKN